MADTNNENTTTAHLDNHIVEREYSSIQTDTDVSFCQRKGLNHINNEISSDTLHLFNSKQNAEAFSFIKGILSKK